MRKKAQDEKDEKARLFAEAEMAYKKSEAARRFFQAGLLLRFYSCAHTRLEHS